MDSNKREVLNQKTICGIFLVITFTFFSLFYIRNVVMTTNGWWQYYAQRIWDGDVLYKDIYLYMPPYFPLFTALWYPLFKNHFILYVIFLGYPIKIACIWIMYTIMCKITKPLFAAIATLFGAVISATYLVDLWYDYNPVLMLPCLLVAYFMMRFYEVKEDKNKRIISFLVGIFVGILAMSKQTYGISMSIVCFLMLLVLYFKEKKFVLFRTLLAYFFGIIIGLMPGILYITINDCWSDFYKCIFLATGAKGGMKGLFSHLVNIMTSFQYWGLAIPIFVIYIINKIIYLKDIEENKKQFLHIIGVACWLFECCLAIIVFQDNIKGIFVFLSDRGNAFREIIFMLIVCLICAVIFVEHKKHFLYKKNILKMICVFLILCCCILFVRLLPSWNWEYIYNTLQLFSGRRILISILAYLFVLIWIREMVYYFIIKKEKEYSTLMFMTLIAVHFFVGIISADTFEEVYMLLYLPWAIVFCYEMRNSHYMEKNILISGIIIISIALSLVCKLLIPYDWQGWKTPAVGEENISCTVQGLEGYKVTKKINRDFEEIVEIINDNCSEDDGVYQWGNITLFNVLTEKKIPVYAPIGWFDVMPDELAIETAYELSKNPPKVVIWHNMNDNEWKLLEDVFRNGEKSGQRYIKKWYTDIVCTEYELVKEMNNYRDGTIQVWVYNR